MLENILLLVALRDAGLSSLCLSLDLGPATALKLCLRASLRFFLFCFGTPGSQKFKVSSLHVSSLGTLLLCFLHTSRPEFDKNISTDGRVLIVKQIQFFILLVMADRLI